MTDGAALDIATRLLPALALILGLPLAVAWWARRHRPTGGRPVRVVAKAGLSRNSAVAVVAVGTRRFLVGAGDNGVSLIGELDPEPEEPAPDPLPSRLPAAVAAPAQPTDERRPWMGLIRRLQQMTLRTAGPPRRPSHGRR